MDERFRVKTPCDRRESTIALVDGALYCSRCEKNVIDLTRATRRQALALAPEGSCVRLRVDPDGNPVFRSDPDRFSPRALALVATLAGCAAETTSAPIESAEAPMPECMVPLEPSAPIAAVAPSAEPSEPDPLMVEEATRRKRRARQPHPPAQPAFPVYGQSGGYEIVDGGI